MITLTIKDSHSCPEFIEYLKGMFEGSFGPEGKKWEITTYQYEGYPPTGGGPKNTDFFLDDDLLKELPISCTGLSMTTF